MKFFTIEDFLGYDFGQGQDPLTCPERLAYVANQKLERDGKIVTGIIDSSDEALAFGTSPLRLSTHKALLINIELLSKCEHPKAKVYETCLSALVGHKTYRCECGAKVVPSVFVSSGEK